ncbi:hypothetical protein B4098_3358 [Heyndrickxia coagulans]|jgi:hypothetical protein|uniref:Uncharacterized protein n=1 Tax=Heyndrickxia coagulans TaxID=1398 RepID=A0A150JVP2_HEYCO|nr:hypothetical protein BCO26_1241 [Heyndrickxia coagulans 2-6]KYC61286.1 hypothetical protein B4099_3582 [Heyndrickxia coagulans]KYC65570.1 hypothetical protein B4098_3358 [Heyndrickxia coagulans]
MGGSRKFFERKKGCAGERTKDVSDFQGTLDIYEKNQLIRVSTVIMLKCK